MLKCLGKINTVADLEEIFDRVIGLKPRYDPQWYHIDDMGIIKYLSSGTLRYNATWNEIMDIGCVFGERVVSSGDDWYIVRLVSGCGTVSTSGINDKSYIYPYTDGSEWDRLVKFMRNPDRTTDQVFSWCQENINGPTEGLIRGRELGNKGMFICGYERHPVYEWIVLLEKLD